MKKILMVAQTLGGGGTEVALVELINHLDTKKYEITLLLMDKDTSFIDRIKRKIKIKYLKFDDMFWHNLVSMNTMVGKAIKKANINSSLKIYDIALKHIYSSVFNKKYDLAIDFYGYGSFTTAIVADKVNASKKVTWLHDAKMSWIKNVEEYFDKYNKIFCVSKSVKVSFDKLYPQIDNKSEVFYNLIDKTNIIRKSTEFVPHNFKKNKFNIVSVGRLTEQKGFDIALESAKILKNRGLNFQWFVVGEGRDRKKLEKKMRKLNLNNFFFFLGQKANPYPYIKNGNVFVLPSRHEGYGLAVLEARILKKPVIVSNIPVYKEQIINNKNGLISELNAEDLSNKIMKLYYDSDLQEKIDLYLNEENIDFSKELCKLENLF
ncbi:glycosyltransferase [Lactobacillus crispatus]|uniref:glycosyltransferase n=1 Tax=Lactobacillus crispatus TaxID=47770 RepID=UPI0018E2F040|nr:glycosyltransferase [Lactobacillus crispatus]MBI1694383.1 glycosyltransferase [Lactobacillus crispatus]